MSHAPKDIHRRLEFTCAAGCTATAICPPGRCVKSGRDTVIGWVNPAPHAAQPAVPSPTTEVQIGGETFAPLVPDSIVRMVRAACPRGEERCGFDATAGECVAAGCSHTPNGAVDRGTGLPPPAAWRYWKDKFACWEYSDVRLIFPDVPAGTVMHPVFTEDQMRAALLPAERACCGTFEGSEHWSTCEAQPERVAVCCGDYAKCQAPCVQRGRWIELRNMEAGRAPLTREQILACVRSVGLPVPMGLTRDSGPYEVTEPTWFLIQLVRAIERAHGIDAALAQRAKG